MSTTRNIVSATIKYGHFPEFLSALKEITAYENSLGITSKYWLPGAGANNQVFMETEFSSLADMEQKTAQLEWDKKHLQLRQKLFAETIEGSSETMLWQELEPGHEFE
ncbi:MAG: hypothetical protein Fur0022_22610 [Anaerolineales bacterium]